MTRETKVGLIVGLAFIVVFAVILSHKGGQPRAARTSNFGPLVDASSGIPAAPSDAGLSRSRQPSSAGAERVGARGPGETGASPGASLRPQPTGSGSEGARPKSLTGTEPATSPTDTALPKPAPVGAAKTRVPLPEMPSSNNSSTDAGGSLSSSLETWLEGTPKKPDADPNHADATVKRTAPPVTPPPAPVPTDVKPPAPDPRNASPATPPPSNDNSSSEPKPRIKQEYIVKSGETLIHIAKNVYGKGSPKEVEVIMAANKKEVPDARRLRAGAKLIIPELPADEFEAATFPPSKASPQPPTGIALVKQAALPSTERKDSRENDAASDASKADARESKDRGDSKDGTAASGKSETSSTWRWYTVREGETLAGIARKHLGSADRWKEIAELNKSKYRDPSRLPAGAKIKLPANSISGLSKL